MSNHLLTAFLLAAAPLTAVTVPALAAQTAQSQEVVAVCATPDGLGRYFRGEIVSSESVRPARAAAAEQHLSLVRDGDRYDLLFSDDGVVRSVRAQGSDIQTNVAEGGAIHHLMVEQDGYIDHFVFQSGGQAETGKVVWATQRVTRDRSSSTASAPCSGD